METLPKNATTKSHELYNIACELVANCPVELGREIGLTGSVSRGVADQFSDIELNFWVDALQPQDMYLDWLRSQRIEPTPLIRTMEDGTLSLIGWRDGVMFEPAWQTFDSLDTNLRKIMNVEMVAPGQLTLAWAVVHAVMLREGEHLTAQKHRLSQYPDALQKRLIDDCLKLYRMLLDNWPHEFFLNIPSGKRGAKIDFMGRQVRMIERLLRILFAINKVWEPEWKWFKPESERLTVKPARLVERVYEVLDSVHAEQSVGIYSGLLIDTLTLLPPEYDVRDIVERTKAISISDWFS